MSRLLVLIPILAIPLALMKPEEPPTYGKDIEPILRAKCIPCHQPNGSGPFSLTTFADAKKRADLIQKEVVLHLMPPTDALSDYGQIPAVHQVTDEEAVLVQQWFAAGAPEGPPTKPAELNKDWPQGPPDLILTTRRVIVPAEGLQRQEDIILPLNLTDAQNLIAFDVKPKSPQALRRVHLAIQPKAAKSPYLPQGIDPKPLLGTWASGYPAWQLPTNSSIKATPDDQLRLQATYQPTGKIEDGTLQVALYFQKPTDKPQTTTNNPHPQWRTLGDRDFILPSIILDTYLESTWTLDRPADIIGFIPEARRFARQVEVLAELPTGQTTLLLRIQSWDPTWIGAYRLPTPAHLPTGTKVTARFGYSLSRHNLPDVTLDDVKRNPTFPAVNYGPTKDNELFWLHVQYIE